MESEQTTKQLVEELGKRLGVESIFVPPHEAKAIQVDGPATVLLIYD